MIEHKSHWVCDSCGVKRKIIADGTHRFYWPWQSFNWLGTEVRDYCGKCSRAIMKAGNVLDLWEVRDWQEKTFGKITKS